jgi:hypothetical protein
MSRTPLKPTQTWLPKNSLLSTRQIPTKAFLTSSTSLVGGLALIYPLSKSRLFSEPSQIVVRECAVDKLATINYVVIRDAGRLEVLFMFFDF